jgi:hypothetical protein
MSHGQPWTHKIHHDSVLGEATTFPLIVFFVALHTLRLSVARDGLSAPWRRIKGLNIFLKQMLISSLLSMTFFNGKDDKP